MAEPERLNNVLTCRVDDTTHRKLQAIAANSQRRIADVVRILLLRAINKVDAKERL